MSIRAADLSQAAAKVRIHARTRLLPTAQPAHRSGRSSGSAPRTCDGSGRARCGFAGYFAEGYFDDHWVVELWQEGRGWRLVDAQVAGAPRGTYKAGIDPLDVPRDQFIVAGEAWLDCRAGRRDPERFGVSVANLSGMWEIQGNVVRDLANLNRLETLPWDNWELIPVRYHRLAEAERELLDRAAEAGAAEVSLDRAIAVYGSDPRLQVPAELYQR